MTKNTVVGSVMAVAVATVLAGAALATPGSGVLSATILARGGFVDPVAIKFKIDGGDPKVLQVRQAQDTVVQSIILGPGGHTGWHSHPGPVVVVVAAGELTFYSADDPTCKGRTYSAGQAFIDSGQGHVHIARNLSQSENTQLFATYFDVPANAAFRIDAADPGTCVF